MSLRTELAVWPCIFPLTHKGDISPPIPSPPAKISLDGGSNRNRQASQGAEEAPGGHRPRPQLERNLGYNSPPNDRSGDRLDAHYLRHFRNRFPKLINR